MMGIFERLIYKFNRKWSKEGMGSGTSYSSLISDLKIDQKWHLQKEVSSEEALAIVQNVSSKSKAIGSELDWDQAKKVSVFAIEKVAELFPDHNWSGLIDKIKEV